jgi:competence protein ComFC
MVKGLYEMIGEDSVKNSKVILVDDVYTSGATVSECSAVLLKAGARTVSVLVAGRDIGNRD